MVPRRGPVLVVVNHPGAYDALAMMSALDRDDVALVAADRSFLRAMPHVAEHLVFVAEDGAGARAVGLRRALARLAQGAALVQFGAGAIEPDARFVARTAARLGAWEVGTGLLALLAARGGAAVVPAFVQGVHSKRAKELRVVRWAERRGITTLAPLVQATIPGFRDVAVSVRFGPAVPGAALEAEREHGPRTALLRSRLEALAS